MAARSRLFLASLLFAVIASAAAAAGDTASSAVQRAPASAPLRRLRVKSVALMSTPESILLEFESLGTPQAANKGGKSASSVAPKSNKRKRSGRARKLVRKLKRKLKAKLKRKSKRKANRRRKRSKSRRRHGRRHKHKKRKHSRRRRNRRKRSLGKRLALKAKRALIKGKNFLKKGWKATKRVVKKLAKPSKKLKKAARRAKKKNKQLKKEKQQDEKTVIALSEATAAKENEEYVRQMKDAVQQVERESALALKKAKTILEGAPAPQTTAEKLAALSLDPEYYEIGQEPNRALSVTAMPAGPAVAAAVVPK